VARPGGIPALRPAIGDAVFVVTHQAPAAGSDPIPPRAKISLNIHFKAAGLACSLTSLALSRRAVWFLVATI
jgi:hypothetical protein